MEWNNFWDGVRDARKVMISAHRKMDGDGLGSAWALCHALRWLGKEVEIRNPDAVPEIFRFIGNDFADTKVCDEAFLQQEAATFDTLLIVDTSARSQLGRVAELAERGTCRTVVIDHHAVGDLQASYLFQDANAPAAGCLVMDALEVAGIPLDYRGREDSLSIAEYLFLAISTDTGWFRFPSVQQKTLEQTARLMAAGVQPSRWYARIYESYPPSRLKLLGVVAKNAQLCVTGRLAYSWISREDFERLGASYSETTDLVNTLMMTQGVEVAVLFCEQEEGTRMNFRSRSDFNVAEEARKWGGGGHVKAAGAFSKESLKNIRPLVLDEIMASMVR